MQISLQARNELTAEKELKEIIDLINLKRNVVSGMGSKVVGTWDLDHAVTVTARVIKANQMAPMTIDEALAFIKEQIATYGSVAVKCEIHAMWRNIVFYDKEPQHVNTGDIV